jgi:hypothetical protein
MEVDKKDILLNATNEQPTYAIHYLSYIFLIYFIFLCIFEIKKWNVEIRMIEGKTFERLKMCIDDLLEQVDTLYTEPTNSWLGNNQAVCQILNISKRSLQTFRDKACRNLQLLPVQYTDICSEPLYYQHLLFYFCDCIKSDASI